MKTRAKFVLVAFLLFLNLFLTQWDGYPVTANEALWNDTLVSPTNTSENMTTWSTEKSTINQTRSTSSRPWSTTQTKKRRAEQPAASNHNASRLAKPHIKAASAGKAAKKVLIVSYMRSGSTFLAALIQSAPNVFYSFEPVHAINQELASMEPAKQNQVSLNLIRSLFRCSFPPSYFSHITNEKFGRPFTYFLEHNSQALKYCILHSPLCKRPDSFAALCKVFGTHLIKSVRLRLSAVRKLVEESAKGELKVVYLVRDPRGIIASRSATEWCNHASCVSPSLLCSRIMDDLEAFNSLSKAYPDTFYKVQFEEMTANVSRETDKLFKFLGMNVTTQVRRFLETHSHAKEKSEAQDPYSTVRDSKAVATAWRKKLNQTAAADIAKSCSSVLQALHYEL